MAFAFEVQTHVQLSGVWTDVSSHVVAPKGMKIRYGINGNSPKDCVADSGSFEFTMNNMADNATGKPQGYYSPYHASVRTGWTYDILCRAVFYDASDATFSVTSITRASNTATVTTSTAHGLTTGYWVTISGATQTDYNGVYQVTVTGATTFTYTVANTPATPATGTKTSRRTYIKHYGRLFTIDPSAGKYKDQFVHCVSYDNMTRIIDAEARELTIQQNKSEAELISAVLDSLSSHDQPNLRDIDTGLDVYAYAFQDIGAGTKAAGLINNACISGYGLAAVKGDGTFIFRSRRSRSYFTSVATFSDSNLIGFNAPSDLNNILTDVRITIHPQDVDATPTTVLYQDTGATPRSINPGETITMYVTYRSPSESMKLIGAVNVVNPLVSGTDYKAYANSNGTGTDLTSSISITITPYGTTAKLVISNSGSVTAYLVNSSGDPLLQVRGSGVYDLGPQTYQAVASTVSNAPFLLDLPYQNSPTTAQNYANFLLAQRSSLLKQPKKLEYESSTAALTTYGLKIEPGDVVTVSETMTGYTLTDATIQSVEITISQGNWMKVTHELAPASASSSWILGLVGFSELGVTTILGF